jgi:hypothetical protein
VPEVRVVAEDGSNLGVLSTEQALRRAQEVGLDLVEVNPKASPPVCKILDFGKYKYEEKKRQRDAKRKQTVVEVKEIKIRPKTDDHDIEVKLRAARKFVEAIPAFVRDRPHLLISLLYLDFDLYEPTRVALEHFLPRMPKGAIVAFDELDNPLWPGETAAALEVLDKYKLRLQRLPFDPYIAFAEVC